MSHSISRFSSLELLDAGEIKLKQVAQRLKLHPREVRHLREKFANEGLARLHSKRKGRPGSGCSAELRDQVIQLIRYHYHDFGPTFASEKLAANQGI